MKILTGTIAILLMLSSRALVQQPVSQQLPMMHMSGLLGLVETIPLPGMPPSSAYAGDGGAIHSEGSRNGWQPWGNGSNGQRFNSSGSREPSVGMGGLWRLMSLAHRSQPSAGSAPRAAHEPRAARTARPAPKPGAPRTHEPPVASTVASA